MKKISVTLFCAVILQVWPIRMEPSCSWKRVKCPTLKCIDATENFLNNSLKLKNIIEEEYSDLFVFPEYDNYTTSLIYNSVPCLQLEISHSNVSTLNVLNVNHPEKYNQIRLSNINLESVDKDVFKLFTNVTRIFMDHNAIASITFSTLHQLEELDLSYNKLQEWTLQLPTLQIFNLKSNELSRLELCNFQNLSSVSISYNNLTALNDDFKCNGMLVDLDVSFNKITTIKANAFSTLILLESLFLNDNQIASLEKGLFEAMKNLRNLYLQNNKLNAINATTFMGLNVLKTLFLNNNNISRIQENAFKDLKKLTKISLFGNPLHTLQSNTFFGLESLLRLDLSNMVIYSIRNNAFNGLTHLKSLDLRNISLKEVEIDSFKGLQNLKTLNLYNNSFYIQSKMFYHLNKVENLTIAKSKKFNEFFLDFESFVGLKNLLELDLSHFGIGYLTFGAFSGLDHLEKLNLSYNNLTELTSENFLGMPFLLELDLRNNLIKKIAPNAFYELVHLETLWLHNNKVDVLEKDAFRGLKKLQSLVLSDLSIKKIEPGAFNGLDSCVYLYLNNNMISELSAQSFEGLRDLTQLRLDQNLISLIEPNAFLGLNKLVTLNLSDNAVSTIHNNTFAGLEKLYYLKLSNLGINSLESKALNGLNSIAILDLSFNNISTIPKDLFNGRKSIRDLDLRSNAITDIEPKTFESLSLAFKFQIDNNSISVLKKDCFYGLTSVFLLNLSNNNVNRIEPGAFNSLTPHSLDLRNNPIKMLENGTFNDMRYLFFLFLNSGLTKLDVGVFDGLSVLPVLQFDEGNFSEISSHTFEGMTHLKFLRFKDTRIGIVRSRALKSDANLYILSLVNATIENFDTQSIPSLEYLQVTRDFSGLNLKSPLCYYNFSGLSIKNVASNAFISLSNRSYYKPCWIDFNYNRLTVVKSGTFNYIDFDKLTLDYNLIEDIEPNAFTSLVSVQNISITFNKLQTIQPNTFSNLINLTHLNLSYNDLTSMYTNSFNGLTALVCLDLSFNKLKTLSSYLTVTSKLKTLRVEFNRLDSFDNCLSSMEELYICGNNLVTFNLEATCSTLNKVDLRYNNIRCSLVSSLNEACSNRECLRDAMLPGVKHLAGFNCVEDKKNNKTDFTSYLTSLNDIEQRYKDAVQTNNDVKLSIRNVTDFVENMTNVQIIVDYNRSLHVKKHHNQSTKGMGIFEILLIVVCVLVCVHQLIKFIVYEANHFRRRRRRSVQSDSI